MEGQIAESQETTLRQTVIDFLEAPRLYGVFTKHLIEFKCFWDNYIKQVRKRNEQCEDKIKSPSCKASIDDGDLEIFIAAKLIHASSITKISEVPLQEGNPPRCIWKIRGEQPYLVDQAVSQVQIWVHIDEAVDWIWTFALWRYPSPERHWVRYVTAGQAAYRSLAYFQTCETAPTKDKHENCPQVARR